MNQSISTSELLSLTNVHSYLKISSFFHFFFKLVWNLSLTKSWTSLKKQTIEKDQFSNLIVEKKQFPIDFLCWWWFNWMNFDTLCFIFRNLEQNRIQIKLKLTIWTIEIILNTHTSKNQIELKKKTIEKIIMNSSWIDWINCNDQQSFHYQFQTIFGLFFGFILRRYKNQKKYSKVSWILNHNHHQR